jgi:hypothetical protein
MKMKTIEFYEKQLNDKGYYQEQRIERPSYIWHIWKDLEEAGVKFSVVMGEDYVTFKAEEEELRLSHTYTVLSNVEDMGAEVDVFINEAKFEWSIRNLDRSFKESVGTAVWKTPIISEVENEDSISKGDELQEFQGTELEVASDGSLPDRRVESGDGSSEHGGQDDDTGLDVLGAIRLST